MATPRIIAVDLWTDRRADVEAELTDAGSGDAGDGVTSQRRGVAFSHSRDPAFRAL
jgi:hypothetical protein